MSKKRSKTKRKRREGKKTGRVLFLFLVLGIFLIPPFWPVGTHAASGVIYKPPRPMKDLNTGNKTTVPPPVDLKKIPDPFLSYLVSEGRHKTALRELEKQKLLAAEKRMVKMKAAAAERLRRMREPKTELQKLNLAQLTLTAIIVDGSKRWAMVRDEKGMGYILKKGTAIGTMGGRVARISGVQKKVVVKEPYLEKELHIKYKPKVIELPEEVFE